MTNKIRCDDMDRLMVKGLFLLLLACFSLTGVGQTGVTFRVEKLSKPERLLVMQRNTPEWLILSDINLVPVEVENGSEFPFGIVALSSMPDSLVCLGYHSFFNGMYLAYAGHRPFVLSPDMIWLLVSQGFARHVNANPEVVRGAFADFSGRTTLKVASAEIELDNRDAVSWEKVFPGFSKQIAAHAGEGVVQLLTSDFSTTTPVEKIASQITLMEAMKPYFEYVVTRIVCGIPEISLRGTPDDWQKVLDKTRQLGGYGLGWWTKELEPLLEEFVRASQGDVDKKFWRNMFKCHTPKIYGAPRVIDGWIVKFFPYDKHGKRNGLKVLDGDKSLPDEIVKVDLVYVDDRSGDRTLLELWAGFFGLEQNSCSFALTPRIGWMIRKKTADPAGLRQKFKKKSDRAGKLTLRGADTAAVPAIGVKEMLPAIFE